MKMSEDLFSIERNSEVGRYAVASKDLKAGDLIFKETPFAVGPKTDSTPLCLGCLSPVDCTVLCTKCSWPVCSPECEGLPQHRDYECSIFASSGAKFQPQDPAEVSQQYECITPLRVLLAKDKYPERWASDIAPMEHHNEKRKSKPIWQFNQTNIVDYLNGPCKMACDPELIHTICGILDVNAFEARTESGFLVRCLYPKLAVLSHSCVSNIRHSIDPTVNFTLDVRAAIDVASGEELFSSYTYSLWPTLIRREFLEESKFFTCKCKRCSDATELGTHLGSLKCQKCDNGVILSTDPLSDACDWKCTHCEFKTNARAVLKVFKTVQSELDEVEMMSDAEGVQRREALFKKYRSVFHPNNSYMTMLRCALSQLYGRVEGYVLGDLPDILLEHKIELCLKLLEVLDVVEPGRSRIRGITLYEIHAPLMMLARNQYTYGVISKEDFRQRMQEAVEKLGESLEILETEPAGTPEGQLGIVAKQAHEGLLQNFEMLIETA